MPADYTPDPNNPRAGEVWERAGLERTVIVRVYQFYGTWIRHERNDIGSYWDIRLDAWRDWASDARCIKLADTAEGEQS